MLGFALLFSATVGFAAGAFAQSSNSVRVLKLGRDGQVVFEEPVRQKPLKRKPAKNAKKADTEPEQIVVEVPTGPPTGRKIVAGQLSAYVDAHAEGAKQVAGIPTFADVVIIGEKGLKAREAEVVLSTNGAEIVSVAGRGVKVKTEGDLKTAVIPLDKKLRAALVVELKLARSGALSNGVGKSELKVALRSPGTDGALSDASAFSWQVVDCSGDFHSALGTILAGRGDLVGKLIDVAKTADNALPGAWLFSPRVAVKVGKGKDARVCLEQTKVWNAKKRRAQTVCTKWEDEVAAAAGPVVPKPPETMKAIEIVELASEYVSTRGAVPALRRGGKFERLVFQINRDIKGFMSQKPHPALCTGTDFMLQYYHDNSKSFRALAEKLKLAKTAGREHIWYRLDRLKDGLKAATSAEATPASVSSGSSSLSIVTPAQAASSPQQESILLLIGEVARLVLSEQDAAAVKRETSPIAALSMFRDLVKTGGLDALSDTNRSLADQVLGMIEATHYVDLANVRLVSVHDALFGNMDMIRAEHKKSCVCSL